MALKVVLAGLERGVWRTSARRGISIGSHIGQRNSLAVQALALKAGINVRVRKGPWSVRGRKSGRKRLPLIAVTPPNRAFSGWIHAAAGLDAELSGGAAAVVSRACSGTGPEGIASQAGLATFRQAGGARAVGIASAPRAALIVRLTQPIQAVAGSAAGPAGHGHAVHLLAQLGRELLRQVRVQQRVAEVVVALLLQARRRHRR